VSTIVSSFMTLRIICTGYNKLTYRKYKIRKVNLSSINLDRKTSRISFTSAADFIFIYLNQLNHVRVRKQSNRDKNEGTIDDEKWSWNKTYT